MFHPIHNAHDSLSTSGTTRGTRQLTIGEIGSAVGTSPNIQQWILTTFRERLKKIGAKVVRQARSITLQLADVVIPGELFETTLQKIDRLRLVPETG